MTAESEEIVTRIDVGNLQHRCDTSAHCIDDSGIGIDRRIGRGHLFRDSDIFRGRHRIGNGRCLSDYREHRGCGSCRFGQQPTQDLREPCDHSLRRGVGDNCRIVVQNQIQTGARRRHQRHRIVRDSAVGESLDPQCVRCRLSCTGVREVLEHQERVEQLPDSGDAFDLGQTGVFDVHDVELGVLEIDELIEQRPVRDDVEAGRNRVAEQPDHSLHPGEFGRSAGHRGPEHDVPLSCRFGERCCPRTLNQGVDRQRSRTAEFDQRFGVRCRERNLERDGHTSRRSGIGNESRRGEPTQTLAPRCAGRVLITAGDPCQVVAIRRRRRKVRIAVVVDVHQLAQDDRSRPPVGEQVMRIEDQTVHPAGQPNQQRTQQRRCTDIEDVIGGLVLELICRAECSVSWNGGQVDRTPLDFCTARNDLNGPFELLVVESCA